MNISCFIIDDESHAIEVLLTYIEKTPGLSLAGYSEDPIAALNRIAVADPPAITFVDIDMPGLSGIDLAGMINLYTQVIFTTSFEEYALAAFDKEAFDYLLKPISYERFLKTINRLRKQLLVARAPAETEPAAFFVKTEIKGKLRKVNVTDIVFIEASLNYVRIATATEVIVTYLTLAEIEEFVPSPVFRRIHRSFIINTRRLLTVEPGQVTLENNVKIPLGAAYRDAFLDYTKESLLQSRRKS